jgi:hypothetical protein
MACIGRSFVADIAIDPTISPEVRFKAAPDPDVASPGSASRTPEEFAPPDDILAPKLPGAQCVAAAHGGLDGTQIAQACSKRVPSVCMWIMT